MKLVGLIAAVALTMGCAEAQQLARRADARAESYPGVDVGYTSVADPKGRDMRIITTKPKGTGRFPTVFVAGWLSCDTVEASTRPRDATSLLFRTLAATPGIATVRMDKPGVGDSEGDCAKEDFDGELAAYRAAFRAMRSFPFVDPAKVYVLGLSNGGGWAPLVAEGAPVAGYVSVGGWSGTWFEHMVEIERNRYELAGATPGEASLKTAQSARLYAEILLNGKGSADVLAAEPGLSGAWAGDDAVSLYGRPTSYYQQLQKLNLADAWSKVKVPTLVVRGDNDWIMSRRDGEGIAKIVNAGAPGTARYVEAPDAGHNLENTPDMKSAFEGKGGPADPKVTAIIVDWLRERAR